MSKIKLYNEHRTNKQSSRKEKLYTKAYVRCETRKDRAINDPIGKKSFLLKPMLGAKKKYEHSLK